MRQIFFGKSFEKFLRMRVRGQTSLIIGGSSCYDSGPVVVG